MAMQASRKEKTSGAFLLTITSVGQCGLRADLAQVHDLGRAADVAERPQRQDGHGQGLVGVREPVQGTAPGLRLGEFLHCVHFAPDVCDPRADRAQHSIGCDLSLLAGAGAGGVLRHDGRLALLHAVVLPGSRRVQPPLLAHDHDL
jgi:hypothetical protein